MLPVLFKKLHFLQKDIQYENTTYPQWPFLNTLLTLALLCLVGLVLHKLR